MELQDGRYYAVHFDEIAAAVNYCGRIVPHVVSRLRGGYSDGIDSPAVWLHVAPCLPGLPTGCDLLLTRGAVAAAVEGGLPTPQISGATRTVLPTGAVLVLGDDARSSPMRVRGPRPRDTERLLDQIIQLSA